MRRNWGLEPSSLFFSPLLSEARLAIGQTHRLTIAEAKVNIPLPAELFRVEIPAGARVIDQTKGSPSPGRGTARGQ
jgi:hypothetical protein